MRRLLKGPGASHASVPARCYFLLASARAAGALSAACALLDALALGAALELRLFSALVAALLRVL